MRALHSRQSVKTFGACSRAQVQRRAHNDGAEAGEETLDEVLAALRQQNDGLRKQLHRQLQLATGMCLHLTALDMLGTTLHLCSICARQVEQLAP